MGVVWCTYAGGGEKQCRQQLYETLAFEVLGGGGVSCRNDYEGYLARGITIWPSQTARAWSSSASIVNVCFGV